MSSPYSDRLLVIAVLDHEQWKPIVIPELKFAGYCPSSYLLPKSDGDWRPLPTPKPLVEGETLWWNYSVALVKQSKPQLSQSQAEAEAAKEFLAAAVAVYVEVLKAAKRTVSTQAIYGCLWFMGLF